MESSANRKITIARQPYLKKGIQWGGGFLLGSVLSASVGAVDIMPLGDSITEGLNACSYRTPLVESFGSCSAVTMVGNRVNNRAFNGGSIPANCIATNRNHQGHSGYSTANFLSTGLFGIPEVRQYLDINTPDRVLLHVGSNDMANGLNSFIPGLYNTSNNTGTGTIGRISQMIDEVYTANPNAKVYMADLIPWFDTNPPNNAPATVNDNIDDLRVELAIMVNDRASDGDDIETVPVSPGFLQSFMQADNIHPNPTGERHMAKAWAKALHDDGICTPQTVLQTPAVGTLLSDVETFTWQLNNMAPNFVDTWQLRAGSAPNSANYANLTGTGSSTSGTLTGLPSNGETVHVTVRVQYFTGEWFTDSRIYTAVDVGGNDFCNGQLVTVYIADGDSASGGNDVILGTAGNDIINSFGGNDTICALGGDDIISSGNGNDWVDAGSGVDDVRGGAGSDTIFGGAGNDVLSGGTGNDFVFGQDGDDDITGNAGIDELNGDNGVDEIIGGPGNDIINTGPGATVGSGVFVSGSGGNDQITGGPDADDIRGSFGLDTIFGGGGNDNIIGGNGRDFIEGEDGDDTIQGNGSNDDVYGGPGNDIINGGTGNDTLFGEAGEDILTGAGGNDELRGGDGNDDLFGSGGNDELYGDAGADNLSGDGNDDTLDGGAGSPDFCDGGTGINTASSTCETIANVP